MQVCPDKRTEEKMGVIRVIDEEGNHHKVAAVEGWRVMEIIRDYGARDPNLGIKAECGGSLACATCHVYVDEAWHGKTGGPGEIEDGMLEATPAPRQATSRLSCQITATAELDGLVLHVPVE